MYVTTCSVTFQLRTQTVPDSEQPSEKRGLDCEELRDRYTGLPRGTAKELVYPCPEGHSPSISTHLNYHRKREDLIVKNFVIVTPAHAEVPSRNWSIHAPKDTENFGVCFLTLVTLIKWLRHSDKVRDTPRSYQRSAWG